MHDLQVTARCTIHDGKLDEFKAVAERCVASVQEKDAGTLQYDWFLNEEGTECVVRERYVDSNAILEHVANLGETFGELLAVCDLKLECCGEPSSELQDALAGLDVKVYGFFTAA